jgi:AcrR family transcriptional regulator
LPFSSQSKGVMHQSAIAYLARLSSPGNGEPPLLRPDGRLVRSARTREAVIEAYLRLIRGGRHQAKIAEIATLAGCSIRTVFFHFKTMLDLATAAIAQVEATPLRTPSVAADRPLKARIAALVEACLESGALWAPLAGLRVADVESIPALDAALERRRQGLEDQACLLLAPELEVLDRKCRRQFLESLAWFSSIESWQQLSRTFSRARMAELLADLVLHQLGAAAAPAPAV